MSPYEISILLWYHCRCEDHPHMAQNPPVWRPTVDRFIADGLLASPPTGPRWEHMAYGLTERGRVYVEALQAVQLPVQVWVMPMPKAPSNGVRAQAGDHE